MKIWKEENNGNGIIIYCQIGKRINKSWWSCPPSSINHVGLSYLTDRYPIIHTEKRGKDFKSKFKELMESIRKESDINEKTI